MAKIKIISNPYIKKVSYSRFDEITGEWTQINASNNENSKLISNDLTSGFLPFKVKEIVDIIINEYDDGEGPITIEFEGTNDEYKELVLLCNEECYDGKIITEKGIHNLENAREILPDIIDIFKELKPIINDSIGEEKIERDLQRFSDASSDIIPICVIGNYSAGKSTFINALIGSEILPSGENPVTAKVFKIVQSDSEDNASITYKYDGQPVVISFSKDGYEFSNESNGNALTQEIETVLNGIENEPTPYKLNKALEIINSYKCDDETDPIDDLIEIEVFFNSMITKESQNPFMVFDTPGSNSASNSEHLKVLREAMEGMSNGIPVFVSEYSKLDTTDNKNLFDVIKGIDNLDSRFTMIVVNKADVAGLPSKGFTSVDEEKTLRLFIPKNLYSGGIYFVSSVMGLGAKTNGVFFDENSSETFEVQKSKYSDVSNKYYKMLYRYNIMPEQIKARNINVSEKCKNLILANSGFYSIESGISTFAMKYSSYDKCQQSQTFLNSILTKTSDEILKRKADVEKRKSDSIDLFEKHKKQLIDKLDSDSEDLFSESKEKYKRHMESIILSSGSSYAKGELEGIQESIIERLNNEEGLDSLKSKKAASTKAVMDNLFENSKKAIKGKFDKEALKSLGETFNDNRKSAKEDTETLKETKREISVRASEELLQQIIDRFQKETTRVQTNINEESIQYWEGIAQKAKQILLDTISDSQGINVDEQSQLSSIIISYPNIVLFVSKTTEKFTVENFRRKVVFDDTVKLKFDKLAGTYNDEFHEFIEKLCDDADVAHSASFKSWLGTLLSKLKENIVSYNQILRDEELLIEKLCEDIKELESKQQKLNDGTEKIKEMMDWKEN